MSHANELLMMLHRLMRLMLPKDKHRSVIERRINDVLDMNVYGDYVQSLKNMHH
jgi:hypothetical protein